MNVWRKGTKRNLIAELAESGKSKREAFNELRPMVEQQIRPMVFARNVSGSRIPKPMSEQLIELKNEIGRVYKLVGLSKTSDFESEETPLDDEEIIEEEETPDEIAEETEEQRPIARGKQRVKDELAYFLRRVREVREFCNERARTTESIDHISMRPAQAASKLIPAGIPADVLLLAMAMHWPIDARRDAQIDDWDFKANSDKAHPKFLEVSKRVMDDREIPTGEYHELFGYALLLAEERQPIMLIGPAGTGKSHLAEQISEYLETPYGEVPLTPGATRGDLLGRHTISGFITAEFCERYSSGGVMNFEEIDAADPGMLIVTNNALARNKLYNSSNGEMYERSPDFIAVSTANTFGIGANRDYTGRERLDAATIDRWRMGRIFLPIDTKVEDSIAHAKIN